jgi:hypothetical protein
MESGGDDNIMSNLELDEATHTYTLDGRRIIGVSEALRILDDRSKVDPFYLERGRLIHLATEYYDRDELNESTIDERIRPYLDAYIKFREDTGFIPALIEHKLYHPSYFYAGTLDRVGNFGYDLLLDLKSGVRIKLDDLQGVAYWELCRGNKISIKRVFDLYLNEDGNYKLEPIDNPKLLLPVFLAALTCVRFKEGL